MLIDVNNFNGEQNFYAKSVEYDVEESNIPDYVSLLDNDVYYSDNVLFFIDKKQHDELFKHDFEVLPFCEYDDIIQSLDDNIPFTVAAFLYFKFRSLENSYEKYNPKFFKWCVENETNLAPNRIFILEDENKIIFENKETAVKFKLSFDTEESPKKETDVPNLFSYVNSMMNKSNLNVNEYGRRVQIISK